MPLPTNENFDRLVAKLQAMGPVAHERVSDTPQHQAFLREFPLASLPDLSIQQYCLGTGQEHSFSWWVERGLEPVMGRYMPGTARGHIVYWDQQKGQLYKHRSLADLSDAEALAYTLKVQHAIASAASDDLDWVDDDGAIYMRAGVEPRVTVGKGRKLRLLCCYHPDELPLISSADHVLHFLRTLGLPEPETPSKKKAVAGLLALRQYYRQAQELVPGLSTRGFMRALYDDALAIAPPPRKEEWDDEEGDDVAAPAYLLTWNPENFNFGGDGGVAVGEERRWTCHSTQPKPGDTVYLIRVGQDPRGIVMRGIVTRGSEVAPHWRDTSKTARYIHLRVDEWRPSAAEGLVPMALLEAAMPRQRWSPQSSGIGIAEPMAGQLDQLWNSGRNLHSLRQFVDWFQTSITTGNARWLKSYREVTAIAGRLRSQPAALDGVTLRRLWYTKDNGVANVGSGVLALNDFDANQDLLGQLTRMAAAKPDADTFRAMRDLWQAAVKAGKLAKVNHAVIRRVLAAIDPVGFTTILNPAQCQKLLATLRQQFELMPPESAESDWPALNAGIAACMRMGGLAQERALENNLAMWGLVESRDPTEAEDTTSNEPTAPYLARPGAALPKLTLPRNIVLYGPPGTGKTWTTIRQALAIVAPDLLEGEPDRDVYKARFDEFVESGQIVFTTFHQSYSYEDFVEGLKATSKDGKLEYSVEPGVFTRLCERAKQGRVAAEDPFDNALLSLRAKLDESVDQRVGMKTSRGKPFQASWDGGETFRVFPASSDVGSAGYTASMRQVRQLFASEDEHGMYNASYVRGMLEFLQAECGLPQNSPPDDGPPKPFVLVIDEINRGSISRIFGELITLLEPSKRAGTREALTITLPYSKAPFSVPANVHIIATMNTADRSLTGMDIALRRRFEFVEMPPLPSLLDKVTIGDLPVGQLLRVMNERIELLLDRDHCLGHASFMALEDEPTLARLHAIFENTVVPLLQEYFFDDWQRIQWVLNDHRKSRELQFVRKQSADMERLFGGEVTVNAQKQRWEVNADAFKSLKAYLGVIDANATLEP
jgi:5-methylcytosine-specific restriction enzyme B